MLAIDGQTVGQGIKKKFFSKSDFFIILRALDFVKNINVNILVLLMQV